MLIEAAIGAGVCGAAAAGVFSRAVFMPRSQICGPVIFRGPSEQPARIALTFDDGPDPEATPCILDALHELDVPAAFFVVGKQAAEFPEIVRRITQQGHLVGNHSYEHANFGTMRRRRYWIDQLTRTNDAIEQLIGRRPAMFRPPMGFKTFHITSAAKATGQTIVTWTRRAFDGLRPIQKDTIVNRLLSRTCSGDIVMMHDGFRPQCRENLHAVTAALPQLVQAWRERGLNIVRLDELISVRPYQSGNSE